MLTPTENVLKNRQPATDGVKKQILDTIDTSARLTRPMLESAVLGQCTTGRKQIRAAVRALVDQGVLAYTYEHGCSFVERSFAGPVRISRRVVIKPPNTTYHSDPNDVVVVIDPGDAFGTGRHPTTRLAVLGVETAIATLDKAHSNMSAGRLLDIGTGSGVLLIAALLMGIGKGVGIDIEPCAVAEARKNIQRNHLSDRAVVTDRDLGSFKDKFSMITANLRYPSLIRFAGRISALLHPQGLAIFSGIKADEFTTVQGAYADHGLTLVWQANEKDWVGAMFRKTG